MPHQQIRSNPRRTGSNQRTSTPDLDGVLRIVQGQRVNILGIAGSDHELDGEVGLMVPHAKFDELLAAIQAEYPETFPVGPDEHLHLDWVNHETGGLLATIARARIDHPNSSIRDIAVGLDKVRVQIGADSRLVLDADGEPVKEGDNLHDVFLVQIYFIPGKAGR